VSTKQDKKHIDADAFAPFKSYIENRDALSKHIGATDLAYALAISTFGDRRLEGVEKAREASINYSRADFGRPNAERIYGWVSFEEFAQLEKLALSEVEGSAGRGELGAVEEHPESGRPIVVWPTSKCSAPEVKQLKLGSSRWSVRARRPNDVAKIEVDTDDPASLTEARNHLIFLGRELGEPVSVYEEAQELFYRGCYLNLWSSFETFVKDSFGELVRRFPVSLARLPDWRKLSMTYADLVVQTNGLSDIESLREQLVAAEIAKAETGGRSISGLINLMKTVFEWPRDLYKRPYREKGQNLVTAYSDLDEIREVRNVLAHQRSRASVALVGSKRLKMLNDRPVIDKAYFDWTGLVLSAIAHGLAEDVVAEAVSVRSS
jgi:hypothetical protein